jgi:tryptophan synthase alpha chain
MLATVRPKLAAPVVLFTYANPLARMGFDPFARRAAEAGVDGVLALDLPVEEAGSLRGALDVEGLAMIYLLSPTTTRERIERAASLGGGFLYGISRLGVTGVRDRLSDGAHALASRVRAVTPMPLALGFGISRPEHVSEVGRWADAAVVGSALVRVVAEHGGSADLADRVAWYVRWLKGEAATSAPGEER